MEILEYPRVKPCFLAFQIPSDRTFSTSRIDIRDLFHQDSMRIKQYPENSIPRNRLLRPNQFPASLPNTFVMIIIPVAEGYIKKVKGGR